MRRVVILLLVLGVFGCVESGASEPLEGSESEVEVVCKHPMGSVELYRVKGMKGLYGLTKSRSGLWYFRGERLSDGKLVDVLGNDCFVEREVR